MPSTSLTQIDKQNLSAAETVLTVIAVNVVMLMLLELPLIGYSIAPEWTSSAVERLKDWLARNGQRAAVIGATIIGFALITGRDPILGLAARVRAASQAA